MMSRMPRPRAIEAPKLRAMVVEWFESVCTSLAVPSRSSEMRARISGWGGCSCGAAAGVFVSETARRRCGGSDGRLPLLLPRVISARLPLPRPPRLRAREASAA